MKPIPSVPTFAATGLTIGKSLGLFVVALALSIGAVSGATYYIDPAQPDDSGDGLTIATAWQRCPGMTDFGANYVHQPGDRFIFKGGTTFTIPLAITFSGETDNPDYYGVDPTWYVGMSWTRPKFDGQGTQTAVIRISSVSDIYLDGLEVTNVGNLVGVDYQGCIVLYDVGPVTINNVYVHNWDFTGTDAAGAGGIVCNPQRHQGNIIVQNSIVTNIDGNQSHGGTSFRCGACLANIDIIKNCELGFAAQGLSHGGLIFANNYVHDMGPSFFTGEPFEDTNGNGQYDDGEPFTDQNGNGVYDGPAHDNCVYWDSSPAYQLPGSYYGGAPLLAYGNFFYQDLSSTGALYAVPRTVAQENFYAFDNIFYAITPPGDQRARAVLDVDARAANPEHPPQIYFYNNTVNVPDPQGGQPIRCNGLTTILVNVRNNHFTLLDPTGSLVAGDAQFFAANNVVQTPADFTASGYVLGNLLPIGPAPAPVNAGMMPVSTSAPTVNSAVSLVDPAVPNLNVDYRGNPRATTGSWDAGAYESLKPLSIVSRKQHGTAGAFDVDLPLTGPVGIECRKGQGPALDQHQLVFTFPGSVSLSQASVSGTGLPVIDSPAINNGTVTVNLSHIANAQVITVKLSNVTDGIISNDVIVPVGVLLGDANSDGAVNVGDTIQVKSQSGSNVTNLNFRKDLNTDGAINIGDTVLVRSQSGTGLP